MTEEQIEICKTCLNRKTGDFEPADICNIRGNVLVAEETCNYFDLDKKVVTDTNTIEARVRPNDQRARLAIAMIAIVLLFDIISFISSYMQMNLLTIVKNHGAYTDADLNNNDLREQAIGIAYLIAFIISAVVFIQWFRRAYYNLQIRTGNCEHSEGWAAGSWFVPIICLFRPYHIMKELWTKTTNLKASKTGEKLSKNDSIIGIWWTLWIVSNYLGNYLLKSMFDEAKTIEDFLSKTRLDMVNTGISIPLAIFTILMIRAYNKREVILNG